MNYTDEHCQMCQSKLTYTLQNRTKSFGEHYRNQEQTSIMGLIHLELEVPEHEKNKKIPLTHMPHTNSK